QDSADHNHNQHQRQNRQQRDDDPEQQLRRHVHTLRSASTTRIRIAPNPGRIALANPTARAAATPEISTLGDISSAGSRPAIARLRTGTANSASRSPIQPSTAITSDSLKMNPSTARSEKPIAFRMAISGVRSRTEMAMVFPVTSNKVKKTTVPMLTIRNLMFPNCFTHPAANADSVSVLVS